MTDLAKQVISRDVDKIILDNSDEIVRQIFKGTESLTDSNAICSKMVFNCLSLSVKLSYEVLVDTLEAASLLQMDQDLLKKIFLQQLSSDLEH